MKIISSREVYDCGLFQVTENEARDGSGFEIKRAVVRHAGSAVVMAIDGQARVLLVRQFRVPVNKNLWELPAGRVDEGETPLQAAKRELVEETGYRARSWKKIAAFWPSPGYVSEQMTIFLAQDLTEGQATPMHDEKIETRWFDKKELDGLIGSGKMQDGKTLIGFMHWRCYRPKR